MNRKAVVLYSGGLDSSLAVRILQEQGIELEGLNVRTPFECCHLLPGQVISEMGIRVTSVSVGEDYFGLLKTPKFNYGRGANPCTDCRIYMVRLARRLMDEVGASFLVTGEVLAQRPNSQMRDSLQRIEYESGCEGILLRPLSAKLLKPTLPEKEGIVDRSRLYGFKGRGRRDLIDLAGKLGLTRIPEASVGCALCKPEFGKKVFDMLAQEPDAGRWSFELLKHGRHLRLDEKTRLVIGRDRRENELLTAIFQHAGRGDVAWVRPENFNGPHAIVIGEITPEKIETIQGMLAGYARQFTPGESVFAVTRPHGPEEVQPPVQPIDPYTFREKLIGLIE